MSVDLTLYLVTDAAIATRAGHRLPDLVAAAVAGGVTAVQVREKHAPARAFLDTVLAVAAAAPPHVPVIVNDRVDVYLAARAAGAAVAGVHLGQSDLPASIARTLIGPGGVIGVSVSTDAEMREASPHADYLGIGPYRATSTKPDAANPLGLRASGRLAAASTLPVVAIGGITATDAPVLRAAGVSGIAVVSAVCGVSDPSVAAASLRSAWETGR